MPARAVRNPTKLCQTKPSYTIPNQTKPINRRMVEQSPSSQQTHTRYQAHLRFVCSKSSVSPYLCTFSESTGNVIYFLLPTFIVMCTDKSNKSFQSRLLVPHTNPIIVTTDKVIISVKIRKSSSLYNVIYHIVRTFCESIVGIFQSALGQRKHEKWRRKWEQIFVSIIACDWRSQVSFSCPCFKSTGSLIEEENVGKRTIRQHVMKMWYFQFGVSITQQSNLRLITSMTMRQMVSFGFVGSNRSSWSYDVPSRCARSWPLSD